MHRNIKLFAAFSSLFLAMCTFYDQGGAIVAPNGLSCQNRTDYGFLQQQQVAECYYKCPDGTVRQPEIVEAFSESSPLYSASREEVDAQFCQGPARPTATPPPPTESLATEPPITEPPTEPPATKVPATSVPPTEQIAPSATFEIISQQPPLLRGDVTMCDVAINLINFRMIEPVPNLTGRALEVEIANQPSSCSINPTNTSLLTCTLPAGVTFPTRVLVRLDSVVVNDFDYSGLGCAKIATAFPTTTP